VTGTPLASLREGYRALVFGATGGIGEALVSQLAADPRCANVFAVGRAPQEHGGKVEGAIFDLEDEASIVDAVGRATANGEIDLVIVATGLLHDDAIKPERNWRALDADILAKSFRINAIGPALVAKHVLTHLARGRKSVFAALSARVSSISDNRLGGWHAYRASKAALNMLIRNFAIELAMRNREAVCVGLHPGTVDTPMSRPFQANVPDGKLFSPEKSAACLISVIDGLTSADSGKLIAWDGAEIGF